jgi:hypothetical protein
LILSYQQELKAAIHKEAVNDARILFEMKRFFNSWLALLQNIRLNWGVKHTTFIGEVVHLLLSYD